MAESVKVVSDIQIAGNWTTGASVTILGRHCHCSQRCRFHFRTIWWFSEYKVANQKVLVLVHFSFLSILLLILRGKHHSWLRLSVCFSYISYDVFSQNPLHYVYSYIFTGSSWISLLPHIRVGFSQLMYIPSGQGQRSGSQRQNWIIKGVT